MDIASVVGDWGRPRRSCTESVSDSEISLWTFLTLYFFPELHRSPQTTVQRNRGDPINSKSCALYTRGDSDTMSAVYVKVLRNSYSYKLLR